VKGFPEFKNKPLCSSPEIDSEIWFAEQDSGLAIRSDSYEAETARYVCSRCPAKQECYDYAISFSGLYGIWAGLTMFERTVIQTREKINTIPYTDTYDSSFLQGGKMV
jgi:hypothetical protein